MQTITGDADLPRKKRRTPPRLFFNTEANVQKSLERMSRWVLRSDVSELEIKRVNAAARLVRIRLELFRLAFDREKWVKDCEIENRLQAIEEALAQENER